MHFASYE